MSSHPEATSPLLPWWQEWEGRLEWELDCFAERDLPVKVLEDPRNGASRLVIETSVDLPAEGPTRIVVVYPDGYPNRRFAVYAPTLTLPRHQAPDGNLCVFPRDARFWDPAFAAADAVADQVPRLVRLVHEGGEALRAEEDPQGEPFTTYYGGNFLGGIVTDERILHLDVPSGSHGTMEVAFNSANQDWVLGMPKDDPTWVPSFGQGLVTTLHSHDGTALIGEPAERLAGQFGPALSGRWLYLQEPPRTNSPQELWDAITSAEPVIAEWANHTEGAQLLGLCVREEVQQDVYGRAWVFLARTVRKVRDPKQKRSRNPGYRPTTSAIPNGPPSVVRGLRYTPEDLAVRIPDLAPLRQRTVSVVGLGSLGAPLVQELAKSRIGYLRLCDFDFVDPATSVRYPLGLDSAGIDKGMALWRWVQLHNPEVEVQVHNNMFGAVSLDSNEGKSEQEVLTDLLDGTDLLVSATAEPDVSRQLDLAARRKGVPRLFMWSQSGYGGVVALLQEGRTGCFHCLSLHITRKSKAGEHVVQVPPDDTKGERAGTIQGPGCGDKTFTANHADLLPLSIQAARVAYGHLCGPDGGYPEFKDDVFAVQVREPDGQPIPPRWHSFKLPPDPECPICNPA